MYDLEAYILLAKTVTLVFGSLIGFYSVRAARRTALRELWALAIGISLITVGSVCSGMVHRIVALDTDTWIGIASTITAVGFVILAYSLYVGRTVPE